MRGLFGGRRPSMGDIGTFLMEGPYGIQSKRQRERETMMLDKLRSDLSPLDGADGSSGTGPARSQDQIRDALMQAGTNGINVSPLASVYNQMTPDSRPQFFNTRDGVVSVMDGQDPQVVYRNTPEGPNLPPGWRTKEDGTWEPIPGGPADPGYIRGVSNERREAITSNPMPRVGAAGRGSASPQRGSSARAAAPARRPWEKY